MLARVSGLSFCLLPYDVMIKYVLMTNKQTLMCALFDTGSSVTHVKYKEVTEKGSII